MTNVEALKKLFIALGGSEEDFNANTNPEAIELIAQVASSGGGGSALPEVSAADNGKVLMVVDGVWAAAELNP